MNDGLALVVVDTLPGVVDLHAVEGLEVDEAGAAAECRALDEEPATVGVDDDDPHVTAAAGEGADHARGAALAEKLKDVAGLEVDLHFPSGVWAVRVAGRR